MKVNIYDVIIVIVLVVLVIAALIVMSRNKGKCAYCNHADSCPFKKVKDVK